MTRLELEHVIRAAAAVADVSHLVVIGSQAILGEHPDAPTALLASMEADVYPKHAPEKAIVIDGAIGERSMFHDTFGYYAHGIAPETAVLPVGWQARVVVICNANTNGLTGECLETHDLAVSKLAAGREKDLDYVHTLLNAGLAEIILLHERIDQVVDVDEANRQRMHRRLQRVTTPPQKSG